MITLISPQIKQIDDELSKRFIALDPGGYFIIYIDRDNQFICAEHYTNVITEQGLAADPETGEVIACKGATKREAKTLYKGRSAKELAVKLFEKNQPCPVTMLDHAAYLGREFVRAEFALVSGETYIQD
jgi:dihydropteroate synthase